MATALHTEFSELQQITVVLSQLNDMILHDIGITYIIISNDKVFAKTNVILREFNTDVKLCLFKTHCILR